MLPQNVSVVPPDLDAFVLHWQKIGKVGLMPTLRGFLDAPPFKLQSEVAIVDVVSPTDMRFRLFGTGLSSLSGHDLTGSDVLSNFHPTARAAAASNAWAAVTLPCGYFVRRDLRHGLFKTHAVGIGLPLLHEQSGRVCLVVFSSTVDKSVDAGGGDGSPVVYNVSLMRWINIGAGTLDTGTQGGHQRRESRHIPDARLKLT